MTNHLTNDQLAAVRELYDKMLVDGVEHFDMSSFGSYVTENTASEYPGFWNGRRNLSFGEVIERGPSLTSLCGYAACIAGYGVVLGFGTDTDTIAMSLGMVRWCDTDDNGDTVDPFLAPAKDWFYVDEWPAWARAIREDVLGELLEDGPQPNAWRMAEYRTVVQVMDDLIHGRRANWFDDDTEAVDHADLVDASNP